MDNTRSVPSREPEEWVVERACKGDIAAFDELITRHRTRALRIARFYCRDEALARGIARDAFIQTLLSAYKLNTPEKFLAHLAKTIRSISARSCQPSAQDEVTVTHLSLPEGVAPDIQAIMDNLPDELSEVLFFRDVCGLSYSAVAAVTCVPKFLVAFRVAEARKLFYKYRADLVAADEEV